MVVLKLRTTITKEYNFLELRLCMIYTRKSDQNEQSFMQVSSRK